MDEQQMELSWDGVDGIMQCATRRGWSVAKCKRRDASGWSRRRFQERHEYVTVINDLDGHVLRVAVGRGKGSLEGLYNPSSVVSS